MKILFVSYNYTPELTGIGKYNGEMASYLVAQGHQVKVITGYPYYPQWKVHQGYKNNRFSSESIDGVSVTRCPLYVPKNPSGVKRILQDFSFFISSFVFITSLIFQRKKYDTVFAVAPSFMNGLTALWYKLFFPSTKIVNHLQDLQIDAAKDLGVLKNKFLLNILFSVEKCILSRVDLVSTITTAMQRKIASKKAVLKKSVVFPNWTDILDSSSGLPDNTILKSLNIPTDKKIVFYSGAVGEKQGIEIILDVAQMAIKDLTDVFFVIAGAGPYMEKLKHKVIELVLTNIQFINILPKPEFNSLLRLATLHLVIQKRSASDLVMPSKLATIFGVGGLALVTAEKDTSLHTLITDHKMAIPVEPENSLKLYQSIYNVVSSLDNINTTTTNAFSTSSDFIDVHTIKKNAIEYARQNLSKDVIINEFLKTVQAL